MKQIILVFLGGGFGSALRYVIGKYLNNSQSVIPYGTFVVNIMGCFVIGVVLGLATKNNTLNSNQTLLLASGFCGGFTTFSAFAYENMLLLKSDDYFSFATYTILSFAVGFLAVVFGIHIVKWL